MKTRAFNPPWQLAGEGYIILYKLSKKEILEKSLLPQNFSKLSIGGLGMLMIVDYKESNVGPYKELLFIPGKINYGNQKLKTISHIFVSTNKSVFYGRKNWGIPKQKADFLIKKRGNKTKIRVSDKNDSFLELTLNSCGPRFPVNTFLMPLSLVQEYNQKKFHTKPKGNGMGRVATIKKFKIDSRKFPDISNKKPLLAIEINCFKMIFPSPQINPLN